MLEGACGPWVELTHSDGGHNGKVSSEQVVVTDSHKVSDPVGLG